MLTITRKLVLFAVGVGLAEGVLMGALLHVGAGAQIRYSFVFMAAGFGALLTMLVGLFVVRQVARPLAKLSEAARRIGRGRLDVEVDVRGEDEIGQLALAFREMQDRLRRIYEQLESRVQERTASLEEATDSLNAALTQRKALEQRLRQYTDNLEQMVAEKTVELRELNAELVRANQLKSQFLANMSHELRTPLSAIIGFAEAIRDGVAGEPSGEQREFAEDIAQAGRQLLELINNLLDLSRFEAGAMELALAPCDVGGLVDEVLRILRGLARRKNIELKADVAPRPLELTADPIKLKQVLYNLLANSIKFTDAGGRVEVQARQDRQFVRIRVSDTGIGIAPEDLVTVFEEFRQVDPSLRREHEGSGLGLALVKRLVELHGGEVAVESQPGKGTMFTVTLLRDLVPPA